MYASWYYSTETKPAPTEMRESWFMWFTVFTSHLCCKIKSTKCYFVVWDSAARVSVYYEEFMNRNWLRCQLDIKSAGVQMQNELEQLVNVTDIHRGHTSILWLLKKMSPPLSACALCRTLIKRERIDAYTGLYHKIQARLPFKLYPCYNFPKGNVW